MHMPRIALGLEYDGTAYRGWQTQLSARSVQSEVEQALAFVADHAVETVPAGRTDAGVHAAMQVIHFDTPAVRSERGWVLGINTRLPNDISALWARPVPEDFHARYGALSRTYRYCIQNRGSRAALQRLRASWIRDPLNAETMHIAAQALIGEHDFSAFRAAACQSRTPMRRLDKIAVSRQGEFILIDVSANAFLHHMVRNIAGALIAVGAGDRPTTWVQDVLLARDRRLGGITAPPQGLALVGVRYPTAYGLPSEPGPDTFTAALPE
jgi:tRNA pseudouridine38-40 synthase